MNANELADWIDERNISSSSQTLGKAATMLRQQQAEIEALKAHPVKELTDDEIIKTMVQFDVYSSDDHCLIEAGRAILRKASEK